MSQGCRRLFPSLMAAGAVLCVIALAHPTLAQDLADADESEADRFIAAVNAGDTASVEALIAGGANVNQAGSRRFPPLFHAVRNGDDQMVHLLLAQGADPQSGAFYYRFWYDVTPLSLAIQLDRIDLVRILLDAGADVNTVYFDEMCESPYTTLNDAIIAGSTEIVLELLRHGADPKGFAGPGHICRPGSYLELAAAVGNVDLVRLFAAEGVVVDPERIQGGDGNDFGLSPLMVAACSGHAGVVKALLDEYGVAVMTKNRGGCTALDYAILNDRAEVAEILRSAGAVPDREGCRAYNPFGR